MAVLLWILSILGFLVLLFAVYLLVVALMPGFKVPKQDLHSGRSAKPSVSIESPSSRKEIQFDVSETSVSAWFYQPEVSEPVPCIVMSNGLGGTKTTGLDAYARRFCEAGFAVLAFDFRFLGDSDGEPRQLVWIPYQLEDTLAAVAEARKMNGVDPDRIALWGTSLSAGHAIVTAAKDHTIACISAQCPFLKGSEAGLKHLKEVGWGALFRMLPHGQRDLVRSWFGLSPHKLPLVGRTGSLAHLADDHAMEIFSSLAPDDFVNEICARILIRMDKYSPVNYVHRVQCPVLFQVSDHEMIYQKNAVEHAKARLGSLAEIIHYPVGHFDVYIGDTFQKCVADQIRFFKKHLNNGS